MTDNKPRYSLNPDGSIWFENYGDIHIAMTDDKAVEAVAKVLHDRFGMLPWASGTDSTREYHRDKAKAAIAAYKAHLEAEGMVVVPREPTRGMLEDGATAIEDCDEGSRGSYGWEPHWNFPRAAFEGWQAMIDHLRQQE